MNIFFLLTRYANHRDLHSFPTRRSSDLDADGAAVGPLEVGEDLAQGHLALAGGEVAGGERLVELLFGEAEVLDLDRKSTRLNSSHANISYAVFCLKKKNNK